MAFNVILRLRRDTAANYQAVSGTFIPKDGEVCLIDTTYDGLRFKVGDGVHPIGQLGFEDLKDTIVSGYYENDEFYSDTSKTRQYVKNVARMYVDYSKGDLYYVDEDDSHNLHYYKFVKTLPTASSSQAGILYLYEDYKDESGTLLKNEDGTMTQKATIEAIQGSLKLTVNPYVSESISFTGFNIENTNV